MLQVVLVVVMMSSANGKPHIEGVITKNYDTIEECEKYESTEQTVFQGKPVYIVRSCVVDYK
jgi:hypothetical protein